LELGIDAATIPGTGPGQAVTLEDIERAAAATRSAAMQSPTEKTEQMRCAMAIAMARSKREIPHYYLGQTISLGAATAWLEARNATRPVPERVLLAALLIKAVALACRKHTAMNGFYLDGEFAPSPAIHVGVAISLRQGGLVAPALHDADQKDLGTLMAGLSDLVQRARAGSLRSSEMADPTITVTNLGDQGVEAVYGVIYPPQVALVGFGAVTPRPWVEGDSLTVMPCATGSLSADHRVSTGHQGALFLAEISRLLQQPESL
jgi:pyruvate dehydrogenase E2 component (dihydrolipoamide acetyltransferase)